MITENKLSSIDYSTNSLNKYLKKPIEKSVEDVLLSGSLPSRLKRPAAIKRSQHTSFSSTFTFAKYAFSANSTANC